MEATQLDYDKKVFIKRNVIFNLNSKSNLKKIDKVFQNILLEDFKKIIILNSFGIAELRQNFSYFLSNTKSPKLSQGYCDL